MLVRRNQCRDCRLMIAVMGFCTCADILIRFVFILVVPYLIRTPGLNLGARLGFVMGFIALCGTIFVFFVVPETKGESPVPIFSRKRSGADIPVRQELGGNGRTIWNEVVALGMAIGHYERYRVGGRSGRARRSRYGKEQ